jgi:clan AA aspartic protease
VADACRLPGNMPNCGDSMIRGVVDSLNEAVVRLRLRGPRGMEADTDAIVDTGFTSSLTMPASIVTALGLIRQSRGTAQLADGSTCQYDVFDAEVAWDGTWRPVLVSVLGDEPLLGMRLMAGHRLVVDVASGGLVEIFQIP